MAIAVFLILITKSIWNIIGIIIYLNLEFDKCSSFVILYYNTEFMVYFIYFACLLCQLIFKSQKDQSTKYIESMKIG